MANRFTSRSVGMYKIFKICYPVFVMLNEGIHKLQKHTVWLKLFNL